MKNKSLLSLILATISTAQLNYLDAAQDLYQPLGGGSPTESFGSSLFSGLYSKLALPEWAKLSNFSMLSTPQWVPNFTLPDLTLSTPEWISDFDISQYAPSVPTISSENFSELMPSQQAVIAGALSVGGLYGAYRYHKAYIRTDLKLIEQELKFIEELIADPYVFHVARLKRIESINAELAQHKANIIRALGLTPSFINPKSYLARLYQEQLDQITTLFNNLNSISRSVTIQELRAGGEDQSIIINNLLTIYFYLLQALNAYKPETLNKLIQGINIDRNYKLSEALQKTFPAYMQVRDLGNKLMHFNCQACDLYEVKGVIKSSKNLLNNIEYQLYGYKILRYFLSKQKKKELNELNNLFALVQTTLINPPQERGALSRAVTSFLNELVNRLPANTKWAIVKDYLTHYAKESFYLYTDEPERTAPEKPQAARSEPHPVVVNQYFSGPQQPRAIPGQQQNPQAQRFVEAS